MLRLFGRHKSVKEYTLHELKKELRKLSRGRIPADVIESLAQRTVESLDFNNSYQMHKSIRGYAEILVQNYLSS